MAGWGIPVGCMPVGPSIREWGNLTEETRVEEDRKTRRQREKVSSEERVESGGVGGRRVSKQERGFW